MQEGFRWLNANPSPTDTDTEKAFCRENYIKETDTTKFCLPLELYLELKISSLCQVYD